MTESRRYWFPAKRYGWGWGPPVAWQGWVVMGIVAALLLAGAAVLLPARGPLAFIAWAAFLSMVLVGVCLVIGEPPKWRWGGK